MLIAVRWTSFLRIVRMGVKTAHLYLILRRREKVRVLLHHPKDEHLSIVAFMLQMMRKVKSNRV